MRLNFEPYFIHFPTPPPGNYYTVPYYSLWGHEILPTVTGDHFWEQATNTNSKPRQWVSWKWLKTSDRMVVKGLGSNSMRTFYSKTTRTTLPQNVTISTLDKNKRSHKLKQKSVREFFAYQRRYQNVQGISKNILKSVLQILKKSFLEIDVDVYLKMSKIEHMSYS